MLEVWEETYDNKAKEASQIIKEVKIAIDDGCHDLNRLKNLSDKLLSQICGFTGKGKKIYGQLLNHIETIDSEMSRQLRDKYEEVLGYKNHSVFIAASLAKDFHHGQLDKAGKDYFTGHLATVAKYGSNWKEMTVGFLHDAAEDTNHSVFEIMSILRKELRDWGKDSFTVDSKAVAFLSELGIRLPINSVVHFPSKSELAEVEEALNMMNHHTAPSRDEYIARFRGHPLAIHVKLNDLRSNMDIGRLPNPTEKDFARCHRYLDEYQTLIKMLEQ